LQITSIEQLKNHSFSSLVPGRLTEKRSAHRRNLHTLFSVLILAGYDKYHQGGSFTLPTTSLQRVYTAEEVSGHTNETLVADVYPSTPEMQKDTLVFRLCKKTGPHPHVYAKLTGDLQSLYIAKSMISEAQAEQCPIRLHGLVKARQSSHAMLRGSHDIYFFKVIELEYDRTVLGGLAQFS
jgi:hypothetical protein